jgi:hypothetical protein
VLLGAAFVLRATRVLIVEPTNALRKQTFGQVEQLHPLKRLQALPLDLPLPVVVKIEKQLTGSQAWEELRNAHVVVATPNCVSPMMVGVVSPPIDLFDLVLMDEGHHAAAPTWESLIKAFPKAMHALVSATPFRLDGRELPGKTVFQYPLRRAVAERAFSKVVFRNVVPKSADPEASDLALAKEAEQVFLRDKADGLNHRMLIRASGRAAADALAELYSQNTSLRVRSVHSGLSRKHTEKFEEALRSGTLDGIVCVDMFGEGYDLPILKIGVLHAPHQSLVPSLQFIGRFARTSGLKTGDATFLAVQEEVATEGRRLYEEGVDWDELLSSLADGAQLLEMTRQETLHSFDEVTSASADYDAVSPGGVTIFKHVVIYECADPPQLNKQCTGIGRLVVARQWYSKTHNSCLILAADIRRPGWSNQEAVIDSKHDVFLLIYRPKTRRLFIAATERKPGHYDSLVDFFLAGRARKLSYVEMKKVLAGFKDMVHHNVGVKNISPGSPESYRIIAGSAADSALQPGDARIYRQGHFMGRGRNQGHLESIGASSRSRTWGSGYLRLPEFLNYVTDLDGRLGSSAPIAKSGLDVLPIAAPLAQIPENTAAGNWPKEARRSLPLARWQINGDLRFCDLIDLEFQRFAVSLDKKSMRFQIGDNASQAEYVFRLDSTPMIVHAADSDTIQIRIGGDEWVPLAAWLSEYPPMFFSTTLDAFEGYDLLGKPASSGASITKENSIILDWEGCDVKCEFDLSKPDRMTVHRYLRDLLLSDDVNKVILYDHRSGELADYVALSVDSQSHVTIHLYHCKGAGGAPSGARTNDVTELILQTVKCLASLQKEFILAHVKRRAAVDNPHRSVFWRGDLRQFEQLLSATEPIDLRFEIYAVQPGIELSALQPTLLEPMAAAVSYINDLGPRCRLRWMVYERQGK